MMPFPMFMLGVTITAVAGVMHLLRFIVDMHRMVEEVKQRQEANHESTDSPE